MIRIVIIGKKSTNQPMMAKPWYVSKPEKGFPEEWVSAPETLEIGNEETYPLWRLVIQPEGNPFAVPLNDLIVSRWKTFPRKFKGLYARVDVNDTSYLCTKDRRNYINNNNKSAVLKDEHLFWLCKT